MSRYGGSAWEWDDVRHEYYLHQYGKHMPDLNHREPQVTNHMKVSIPVLNLSSNHLIFFFFFFITERYSVSTLYLIIIPQVIRNLLTEQNHIN